MTSPQIWNFLILLAADFAAASWINLILRKNGGKVRNDRQKSGVRITWTQTRGPHTGCNVETYQCLIMKDELRLLSSDIKCLTGNETERVDSGSAVLLGCLCSLSFCGNQIYKNKWHQTHTWSRVTGCTWTTHFWSAAWLNGTFGVDAVMMWDI